jgi:peptidoglycan L-alanyl-D-glutamate endopeptidase CwlK
MSQKLSAEEVLFRQRLLSCCGFYKDKLDGLFGPNTDAAEKAFLARSAAIAAAEGTSDARTERNIATLRCDAQVAARRSLKAIRPHLAANTDVRIISGTRTFAEQNALFRQGRFGNPGPIVTNARGGQSWHNFCVAWDIGLFRNGEYIKDGGPYVPLGKPGKVDGVEWGGDWTTFKDVPHFQFGTAGLSISAARARFEKGCR